MGDAAALTLSGFAPKLCQLTGCFPYGRLAPKKTVDADDSLCIE